MVEHRVVGEPSSPCRETVGLSLYRIAQEAVTNVRRHSVGPARASLVLRYVDEPRAVELEVVDDGRGGPARRRRASARRRRRASA